jgi:hypothetical protein
MGQYKSMGFSHYQDPKKVDDRLVCQYESLYKVFDKIRTHQTLRYEYVILDEAHSILKNMVSKTNGKFQKQNAETLDVLLKMATKVILMDADNNYDFSVAEYCNSIFVQSEMEHFKYTYQPLKRTIVYTDQTNFTKTLNDDIQNGRNVMVCFKTCQRLQAWYNTNVDNEYYINENNEKIQMKFGVKHQIRTFTSDTDEKEMKIFENINELPAQNLFLAFTSKVLVGSDILQPFHRLYLDAVGFQGPTPRQMLQMLGRGRVCLTGEIYVNMKHPKKMNAIKQLDYDDLYRSEFRQLELQKEYRSNYHDDILKAYDLHWNPCIKKIEWTPKPVLKIFAHNTVERSKEFSMEFHRLIKVKGFDVKFDFHHVDNKADAEISFCYNESLTELRNRKLMTMNDALDIVKQMSIGQIEAHCTLINFDQKDISKNEQIINDVLFVCRMYPEWYHNLTTELVKYSIDRKSTLYAARSYFYDEDKLRDYTHDLVKMKYSSMPELCKLQSAYINRLSRLCHLLGFGPLGLKSTEKVPESVLIENLDKYIYEFSKLKSERGVVRCRGGKNIALLRSELKQMGILLHTERVRQEHTRHTMFMLKKESAIETLLPHIRSSKSYVDTHGYFNKATNSLHPAININAGGVVWTPQEPAQIDTNIDDDIILGQPKTIQTKSN